MTDSSVKRSHAAAPTADAYGEYYFAHCCGLPYSRETAWLTFFAGIADRIAREIAPKTVLDAGCAWGLLVEALRERAISADGVDISTYAIAQVAPAVRPYCRVGSLTEPLPSRYDLIVCMEVVEHMTPADAEAAIHNICAHTDDVLFSSSPLDYKEPTHINVQPPEAWAEAFARHGFFRDPDFDALFVTPWAVRFRRSTEPLPRLVRNLERRYLRSELEKNESRAFGTQKINELAAAEAERAAIQRHVDDLQRALNDASARITAGHEALAAANVAAQAAAQAAAADAVAARAAIDEANFERAQMAARLGHALHTIRLMEGSIFWRMRLLLNRLLGRG